MRLGLLLTIAALGLGPAQAADLVYTPTNPSFGGSPLNSTHLFAGANAQRSATAGDKSTSTGAVGGVDNGSVSTGLEFDLFVRQLQSRLLSALSSQVAEAIFGRNGQDTGKITFGEQEVSYERTLDSIRLVISDFSTGTTTEIEVPQLVVN